MIRTVVLWVLGPTQAPWAKKNKTAIAKEGMSLPVSAVALAVVYWEFVERRQLLYFEPIDVNLVFFFDTLVLPILLSLALLLLGLAPNTNAVLQTLSWIYRAWTLQLLLVCSWALVLKQYPISEYGDAPTLTDFRVVLLVTAIVVSGLVVVSMLRGKESWQNIVSACVVYWIAVAASGFLGVPTAGEFPWWAP